MFDPDSRYYDLPDRTYRGEDGREVVYKARRLLLSAPPEPPLVWEELGAGDRPDLVAYRTLNDPLQFWRLCEANGVADPLTLTAARRRVRVPQPGE